MDELERRLPPHVTEEDLRALLAIVAPGLVTQGWNAAIDAALEQVEIVDAQDAVPLGVAFRLEALKRDPNG